jgi:hypothetical protein
MNELCRQLPNDAIDAGCRRLAVRVIAQAVRDLSGGVGSRADRESARSFLAGSWMLYRWCEIANLSAAWTIARARTLDRDDREFRTNTVRPEGDRYYVEQSFSSLDRRRRLVRGARRADRD